MGDLVIHENSSYIPRSYDLSEHELKYVTRERENSLALMIVIAAAGFLIALPLLIAVIYVSYSTLTIMHDFGAIWFGIIFSVFPLIGVVFGGAASLDFADEIRIRRAKVSRETINTDNDIRWLRLRDNFLQQADSDWASVWNRIVKLLQHDTDVARKCDDIIANYMEATEDVPGLYTAVEGPAKTELETDFAATIKATAKKLVITLADHDAEANKAKAEAAKAELDEQLAIEEANSFAAAQQQIILGQKVTFAREKMRQVVQ